MTEPTSLATASVSMDLDTTTTTTATYASVVAGAIYKDSELAFISSIADEAGAVFFVGSEWPTLHQLRDQVRAFAHKKGFAISSDGTKLCCTRCDEPQSNKNKKARKNPVPAERQRNTTTTRVGCSFQVTYTFVDWKNKAFNKAVRITKSSNFYHSNGCLPSRAQLCVEKRKAGTFTVAVHESQIKVILSVMATGTKVPIPMLRQMMKPLFPDGTSLDSKLIFNFRLKIKRMLDKGSIDLSSHTVTEEDEAQLLSLEDLDNQQTPEFLTEAFKQFQELLQESLLDQNDLQQIITYLDSLVACDESFTYRIGKSADGSVTGFVWQTGVMRRDFELFGDVLFVDCLGRSLNNKGWPVNTIAMLDGEKKVALPSEGLTIGESVDSYAWLIQSTADMAPTRKLSDIKIIFADGILSGETLLTKLGISDTCKIVLDHYHLISEDIGAWPKEFGLHTWAHLKQDLTTMVKSHKASDYSVALERVRSLVADNPKFSSYVEDNIHNKRHLFANHVIKNYVGNLHLQGNVPAECNHSSIISRIGSLVVTPVELVRALIKRHYEISTERNHKIQTCHIKSHAVAMKATTESDRMAALSLSSWANRFYGQAMKHSRYLCHVVNADGSHTFTENGNDQSISPIDLPINPTKCTCSRWIATNGTQCGHLLLARKGFCIELWAPRWHQCRELGASFAIGTNTSIMDDTNDDDDDGQPLTFGNNEMGGDINNQGTTSTNDLYSSTTGANRLGLRDALDITRQLGYSIGKIHDKEKQMLLLGAVVKLNEIAKGNTEQISGQSLQEVLDNHLSLFTRNMASQPMFSQERASDKENQSLRRAGPVGTNGGGRLKSANERTLNAMRNSKKRDSVCSLCLVPGHKVGRMCTIVQDLKATLIPAKESDEFAKSLGNPAAVLVETPNSTTKQAITEWISGQYTIPSSTKHLLAKRCFYSARRAESNFQMNVVEVVLMEDGGLPLMGHSPAYFPAWKVSNWITSNCTSNGRKRQVLSSMSAASAGFSQTMYNYSPN